MCTQSRDVSQSYGRSAYRLIKLHIVITIPKSLTTDVAFAFLKIYDTSYDICTNPAFAIARWQKSAGALNNTLLR